MSDSETDSVAPNNVAAEQPVGPPWWQVSWPWLTGYALCVIGMSVAFFISTRAQNPEGGPLPGRNHPDVLWQGLLFSTFELGALWVLVRPWLRARKATYYVGALLFFLPWSALIFPATWPGGSVMRIHALALAATTLGLVIGLIATMRRTRSPQH